MIPIIQAGLSYAEYDALPGLRWSRLKVLATRTPMHFASPDRRNATDTAALVLGRMVHQLVLGGDETFAPIGPRNTKAGKDEEAEALANGHVPISRTDYARAEAMASSVFRDPDARALIETERGANEVVIQWSVASQTCKARIDRLIPGAGLVELKTAADASPEGMAKAMHRLAYHGQLGCYVDGWRAAGYDGPVACTIIAVEKDWPHAVGVYRVRAEAVEQGRDLFHAALRLHAECHAANAWPGYAPREIDLPPYARSYV